MGVYCGKRFVKLFAGGHFPNCTAHGGRRPTGLLALGMRAKWAEQPENQEQNTEQEEASKGTNPQSIYKLHPKFWRTANLCLRRGNPNGPPEKAAAGN